jgi:RNA-directed DNA polymerase
VQFEWSVPVIKDRVVQAAVVLIIEPIFEADFEDCSYGFRPGRNAHQALEQISAALKAGKTEVYDADLEGYFDSIPHDKLMKCVRMRVVDGAVAGLIKQWLEAPVVEEIREEGKRERQPRHKVTRNSKGTPQGGVASPLLANIYLHWFDRVFQSEQGPAKWAKATLIRYADDCVPRAQRAERAQECATAQPMRGGPSEPAYRSRFQTAFGGYEQKSWS